ncbi:MAG: GDSL-type esterase/lipase family protein [Tepidisphaeraceae bacterium]
MRQRFTCLLLCLVAMSSSHLACSRHRPTTAPVTEEAEAAAKLATNPSTTAATRQAAAGAPATRPTGFARWEKEIAAYEAADRASPPAKDAIVFIGSSTIRLWKSLPSDYPNHKVLNRGFGGSQIVDATHFADRIVFPYEPKMIVLRAGGNDIHAGKSVEQVFGDYQAFVARVRSKMPDVPIVYLSMSPAPSRWAERDANKQVNALIESYSRQSPGLKYVETYDMTLTPEGEARGELFLADQLHFNAEGYKLLAERVRPFLP